MTFRSCTGLVIMLSLCHSNVYAKSRVAYYPTENPTFQYTCCSMSQFAPKHRHAVAKKQSRSSYTLSVYYVLPEAPCSACVTWVPPHCTCYGDCIPGHWEAYKYAEQCKKHQPRKQIITNDVSYDMITSDDVQQEF